MKRELPRAKRDSRNLRITSVYERFKGIENYHVTRKIYDFEGLPAQVRDLNVKSVPTLQERFTSCEITQCHREIYAPRELPVV